MTEPYWTPPGETDDERAAFCAGDGANAYRSGCASESNPYEPGTYWFDCWVDGFGAAQEEEPSS